jgi:hypothetical protein
VDLRELLRGHGKSSARAVALWMSARTVDSVPAPGVVAGLREKPGLVSAGDIGRGSLNEFNHKQRRRVGPGRVETIGSFGGRTQKRKRNRTPWLEKYLSS